MGIKGLKTADFRQGYTGHTGQTISAANSLATFKNFTLKAILQSSVVCPGDIDIFRNSYWRLPPFSIFMISEFGTFRHDGCLFFAVYQIWFKYLV